MDHSEAIRAQAVERYLLGELAADLREQFEDHYFSCPECAADLKYSAMFVETAKSVLAVPPVASLQPAPAGWFARFLRPGMAGAGAVLALLLVVLAYQNFAVIPSLRSQVSQMAAPQTLQSFSLAAGAARGALPAPLVVAAGKPFSLFVDVPPSAHFASYTCDFETESGSLEFSLPLSSAQVTDSIQLLIPPSRLQPGKHILVLRGRGAEALSASNATEIARYPFTLEINR
jgi:Putative zinc-finger